MSDMRAALSTPSGRQAAMPFIMLTVLIDMVSIGLIIPVLPGLVGSFTQGSQADQAFWFGVVAFSFGIANFFGSPILGALSDRYGRRPVLLIGFCGLALNFFATALSTALWMLIIVRLVGGAMQSNIAVANAYVADITAPEERAKRFGMLGAMFGVGFIVGPAVGGLLGSEHLNLPFFAAGTLALLNLAYGFFVLPESLPVERRSTHIDWSKANPIGALKQLGQLKGVGTLMTTVALSSLAQFTLHTSWVLYTQFKFGWTPKENGYSLMAVGLMSVLVQGLLVGKLIKRYSPARLAMAGLISQSVAFLCYGLVTEGWMLYLMIALNVMGYVAPAAIQSMISNAATPETQGQTMGAVASLNSLTAVAAPVIGSVLLQTVSHYPKGDWHIGAPFYFCAALQAVATVLAWRHFSKARDARKAELAASGAAAE